MRKTLLGVVFAAAFSASLTIPAHAQISSVERVSVDPSGGEPNGNSAGEANSIGAVISEDGRFAAFVSDASNITSGDSEGFRDVFLRDISAGTTTRVTEGADASSGVFPSGLPASTARHVTISDDGGRLVFQSFATNLGGIDTQGFSNIYLYDATATPPSIRLLSRPNLSSVANGDSFNPSISRDGNVVAFGSVASALFTGDDENLGLSDVFLLDLRPTIPTIEKVNIQSGAQANDESYDPAVNEDGLLVAFTSRATNLAARSCAAPIGLFTTTPGRSHVYLRNRFETPPCTVLVDRTAKGEEPNGDADRAAISADGRRIAFVSSASNLVAGDTNKKLDVFVADLGATFEVETIRRVSVASSGAEGNGDSGIGDVSISSDGRYVTFKSAASNLLPFNSDTNGSVPDIFVHDLTTGQTGLVTRNLLFAQSATAPGNAHVNGSSIVLDTAATNFVAGSVDTMANSDVFLAQIGAPLPAVLTKELMLTAPPIVLVNGNSATVLMQELYAERAKRKRKKRTKRRKPATLAAEAAYRAEIRLEARLGARRARAVTRRQTKQTVRYIVDVKRGGAPLTTKRSKKNVLTISNLQPGSYSASYRVQLKQGKRVRFQSNQSPERSFEIQ